MPTKIFDLAISNREVIDYLDKQANLNEYICELIKKDMKGYTTKEDVANMIDEALKNLKININVEKKIDDITHYDGITKTPSRAKLPKVYIDPNGFTDPKIREEYSKKKGVLYED